ncbi:hypothetical protein PoB_004517000 [Plakobranchus ocellatus]|uniref:Uncharacterized protein n=1 Tax=Plakobranchus ocellatus TaxID=259542 RepID=A0AAV4BGJ6_9GAST|nr:hypothetical protein PoB_004517000 [Plakobranchus ocellatus]
MPQCYKPALMAQQDTSAFGKNSRYMKATNFNQNSRRRVNVLNTLEAKFTRMRLSVLERNVQQRLVAQSKARINILESYKRTMAYRMVLKRHPIRQSRDYRAALNDSYSYHSLRHEVKKMLEDIAPDSVAHRQAQARVEVCKGEYNSILAQNRKSIVELIPKIPEKPENGEEEEDNRTPTPPPSNFAQSVLRRSLVGPPLRGLAKVAQSVSLKMVKDGSWMGTGPKLGEEASSNRQSPLKDASPTGPHASHENSLNPHAKLPPIVKAAA